MSQTLEYKGYNGSVLYSDEDQILHGRILGIRDMVTFEGETVKELKESFVQAIDEYLSFCAAEGKKPDVPFKGSLNVRLAGDLHKRAALLAEEKSENLNKLINDAVEDYLAHEEQLAHAN
jgi:predicted HicB family RNase H-like nuclease